MKLKKGFTLVEIILSIGLIVIVGGISLMSFNLIRKNYREKTLNNMSDEILTALRLYIETNEEAKKNIYEDYEGMAITLNTLEKEGFIKFQDIDVTDGKDYVVAMLSNESNCSDITTVESWDLTNGPLYICSKGGGSQNLFSVGGDADNLSKATREVYYFKGRAATNYIQLNGTGIKYRIISIDKDDSLTLVGSSFSSELTNDSLLLNQIGYQCFDKTVDLDTGMAQDDENYWSSPYYSNWMYKEGKTGVCISNDDIMNTSLGSIVSGRIKIDTFLSDYVTINTNTITAGDEYVDYSKNAKRIHLKPCMEITGGTGNIATPYVLTNNCT